MSVEQRARELLNEDDGNARFSTLLNGRWYVDQETAIRAIARALTHPAPQPVAEGFVVPAEQHMELQVNATALCEQLAGLVMSMWVMGDQLDYSYNNVPVSEIVSGLRAAETAKEMMAAFDGAELTAAKEARDGR